MMDLLTLGYWFSWLASAFFLGAIFSLWREHKEHTQTLNLWRASLERAHARTDALTEEFLKIANEEDLKCRALGLCWALTEFFAGVARSQRVP